MPQLLSSACEVTEPGISSSGKVPKSAAESPSDILYLVDFSRVFIPDLSRVSQTISIIAQLPSYQRNK